MSCMCYYLARLRLSSSFQTSGKHTSHEKVLKAFVVSAELPAGFTQLILSYGLSQPINGAACQTPAERIAGRQEEPERDPSAAADTARCPGLCVPGTHRPTLLIRNVQL